MANSRQAYHKAYYIQNRKLLLTKMAARYRANTKAYKARDNRWRQANKAAINLSRRLGCFIAQARIILNNTGVVSGKQPNAPGRRG